MVSSKCLNRETEYAVLELVRKCKELNLKNINFLLYVGDNYCIVDRIKEDWQLIIIEANENKAHFYGIKELGIVYQHSENTQKNPA